MPAIPTSVKLYVLRPLRFLAVGSVTLFVSWLLFRSINIGLMGRTLAHAHLIFLLPIAAAFLFRYWLRALRWQRLVRHLGHVPILPAFDRVIICQAADRVLPSQLAYPVTVQLAASKFQLRAVQLFGTDLIERMMDGVVYALFLVLAAITLHVGRAYMGVTVFLVCGTGIGLALIWWFSRRPEQQRVPAHWPFSRTLSQFLKGVEPIHDGRHTFEVFIVSLAIWSTEVGIYLMVALALGVPLNPLVCVLLVAMANTGAAVPLVQAAVGFIFVAQQVLIWSGHPAALAATYAASLEALLIVSVLLLAPASAYRLRLGWRDLLPVRSLPVPVRVRE